MKKIILGCLLVLCFFVKIQGGERSVEKGSSSFSTSSKLYGLGSTADVDLMRGLSPIKVLLYVPTSTELSKKLQNLAMQELKKWGQTIIKSSSVQDWMEDKALMHSPILIYEIREIQDLQGNPLDLFQITFTCESSLQVSKTTEYGQGILWSKECFVRKDSSMTVEHVFLKTFPILLQEFENGYLFVNRKNSQQPVFYLIE